jgi:hypothetical protein
VLALAGGVDVLLVSHNTGRIEDRAAQRVVTAVERAMAGGKLSPARVADALAHVDALRGRIGVRS